MRKLSLFLILSFFLLSISQFVFSQKKMPTWPVPNGKLKVIIDTDAANEVDDQWAMALLLGYPERFQIEGFVAAHYGTRGGVKGIQKSYNNILEVLDKAGFKDKFIIKMGSDPISYLDAPPLSEGVDFIIEEAKKASPENPLWVISLGAATNAAAAILKDSSINKNIIVLWHGRTAWPERCWNFNATNDLKAVQVLFDATAPFILFDTGSNLNMPMHESEIRIASNGSFGQYLHDIRKKSAYAQLPDKGMFDLGDIAALIDVNVVKWETAKLPSVKDDYKYDFSKNKGTFTRIYDIEREATFKLLEEALRRIKIQKGE
ncbi:hypothetical protein A5893_13000 [Pedobacter psychrophilus]|uniref:Inosine/uridine-preferring nucleoside hydrolase domain-containing protein n=1 Tax=Pedobacter psychrophilus TaxID=1826909 RepID=A0A179DEM6_9SPHI|nr:nucleoside hydrolase [Pedobacter psychrophilus]OAQ38949.1 hypothetical protein A5893_13000 [Pedobacter psychrophilus]